MEKISPLVTVCLVDLAECVIDSTHHFSVQVFFNTAVGFYNFELRLYHLPYASLQNPPNLNIVKAKY